MGHSTRAFEALLDLLRAWGVDLLVDVRTAARSRRHPQFNAEALAEALPSRGIAYRRMPELGGWRRPRADSPNTAWRNASFRGYADYMQTPGFEVALADLMSLSTAHTLAVMCAEAVPWRCHRSLIADALAARGCDVRHIVSATKAEAHRMTPFARVEGARVWYPGLV
ncbi:MAG TPA: DUF488 domain-containing protein [Dehalococcoidia bacterium]|nr:DUF488 domain-containing protein [Dehalococcoidia bacterium]